MNKKNHFRIVLFLSFLCISGYELKAQLNYKVLFLGNSYTGVNNLPQIVHDVALSAGDTLVFDSYTPGGYQLIDHSNDAISQNKIMTGGWDYVVIQGQSQEPITLNNQFNSGGSALYNQIKQYNPCAVTVPYMTWGRKNGDASNCATFPVMCTYQGMDTTIRSRYLTLTNFINSEVSPVSVVWNYLRQNYPGIELYQTDESHPSLESSYAAACCFYATLFKKDPTLITFDFGLNATDASIIRNAAKTKVFESLQLWDFKKLPITDIRYEIGSGINEVLLQSVSLGVNQTCLWDFGDGVSYTASYAPHSYLSNGAYTVTLTTTTCDLQGLHISIADTVIQFCNHTPTINTSHPWLCNYDTLWTQTADSFQWFAYGVPLPETNQFLANYYQYNISGFSVISKVNGCSELSKTFTETPQWSGYYFDAAGLGNPCIGDTVLYVVLHTNGFLSGFENILWYKNDTLLPLMTNQDTLHISDPGKYKCKVINPNSNCPLDTTSSLIEFDCGTVGIADRRKDLLWNVFPNPATETITIKLMNDFIIDQIQIYDIMGRITKEVEARAKTEINIVDLPYGLYYIRLKNNSQLVLKFIKQ
ncbi:MAG: T9SS type A sorting domain-containing protein [Paludibacter sp.]